MPRLPCIDVLRVIRENMHVVPVPSIPAIRLHTATPASGLRRLAGKAPPYWAYQWAGGLALANYVFDHPEVVAGRRVLDLGAGSGLVGIAAAKAGAASVLAAETDPNGLIALSLNAAENGVTITAVGDDLLAGSPPPDVDIVLAGDVFYDRDLAGRVTEFLDRCLAAGQEVLVGDPGRPYLPRARLRLMAEYEVPDVGDASATRPSAVFALKPAGG